MKPIIKWAGGKTQLLEHIRAMRPKSYNHYFEPFLGGGAVLFDLIPEHSTVNDINPELINMYIQIKKRPNEVLSSLAKLDTMHESALDHKQFYYSTRDSFNLNLNSETAEQAARLIYINKHCFNGLYRVNAKGVFNVPFNNKLKGESFDEANIRAVSTYLQGVKILKGDFETAVAGAKREDFAFFDSPYVPLNPTSFTDYTKEGFDYEDHVRLAKLYKKLSAQGVFCMLTNHNTDLVNELYKDFNIRVVQVARNKYSADKVYGDYVAVYDWTGKKVDRDTLAEITELSYTYGEDALTVDIIFSILYVAMIAEENKAFTRLGKRIKRLGIYVLLLEDKPVSYAANFMRGKGWREIANDCEKRGF